MLEVTGTVTNGVVVPTQPGSLPEGAKVRVVVESDEPTGGMREEDWPTTPEGIAALLAEWKTLEPIEYTPEEEAELRAARAWFKEHELQRQRKEWGLPE
jgi:predicted DNA-binding antitoxin AbrB/MazE fold protein